MNNKENEIEMEEWEEPKVEEAINILNKYFKTAFETAGLEWTDKNDKEITFAIVEIINAPIYEIKRALEDAPCTCDECDD